jgi:hypothetical protein
MQTDTVDKLRERADIYLDILLLRVTFNPKTGLKKTQELYANKARLLDIRKMVGLDGCCVESYFVWIYVKTLDTKNFNVTRRLA